MTPQRVPFLGALLALVLHATEALGAPPLRVELEPTAAALPEGDIRVAIEKELGRPVSGADTTLPSDVTIGVADGKLVIRVKQGSNVIERSVPLPSNLADVPLTVSLIVGNLARDQSVGLAAPPAAPPASAGAPPPAPAPAPRQRQSRPKPDDERPLLAPFPGEARFRSRWIGVHVAQDFALVGGNNVCDPNRGQMRDNYSCFYEGTTDQPFVHTPFPHRDSIQQGLVRATERVLVSFDHAFLPSLSVGVRAGYAFGGGPRAGQEVRGVDGAVPDRARGSGGTRFFPYHLEVKVAWWWLPLTNKYVRAYVQASAGTAQVDAKVSLPVYDCTHAGSPDLRPEETSQSMSWTDPSTGRVYTPLEQCEEGKGYYNYRYYSPTRVDAWKKMGQLFLSLGAGGMVSITDQLGVVLNLNGMVMLPASGFVLQPSLGIQHGF